MVDSADVIAACTQEVVIVTGVSIPRTVRGLSAPYCSIACNVTDGGTVHNRN